MFATDSKGYEAWTVDGRYCAVHTLLAISEGACPYALFASGRAYHVHHKSEVTWDNRPDNLEVLSRAEHCRRTHKPTEAPPAAAVAADD